MLNKRSPEQIRTRFIKKIIGSASPQGVVGLTVNHIVRSVHEVDSQQSIRKRRERVVRTTVEQFKRTPQDEQLKILSEEEARAADAIAAGNPVLIWCFDDTKELGRIHDELAFFDPETNTLVLEIPEKPNGRSRLPSLTERLVQRVKKQREKSGQGFKNRFATALHAGEFFGTSYLMAEEKQENIRDHTQDKALPFNIQYVPKYGEGSLVNALRDRRRDFVLALGPMTYQPKTSYKIVLDPNARGKYVNGKAITIAHLRTVLQDRAIITSKLRHTYLLEGEVDGYPRQNEVIMIMVDHTENDKGNRELYDANRIRFEEPTGLPEQVEASSSSNGCMRRFWRLHKEGNKHKPKNNKKS